LIAVAAGSGTRNEIRRFAGLSDMTLQNGEPDPRGFELVEPKNVGFNTNPNNKTD
jgi:hypothetical protein